MKHNTVLFTTSLLSILLLSIHVTDDIVRGFCFRRWRVSCGRCTAGSSSCPCPGRRQGAMRHRLAVTNAGLPTGRPVCAMSDPDASISMCVSIDTSSGNA